MVSYALYTVEEIINKEPKSYSEAVNHKYGQNWLLAMIEELNSLDKNCTWTLVPRPKGARVVGRKWIYKKKEGIPGVEKSRFKARLVVTPLSRK